VDDPTGLGYFFRSGVDNMAAVTCKSIIVGIAIRLNFGKAN
jgi:hypothetical protein